MKFTLFSIPRYRIWPCVCTVAAVAFSPLHAQQDEEFYELSPFLVEVSGDRGYYAANSISGSRINVLIQDLPLTIEVITSEFIEDTGSTDLRESLRYSAGILLQSQNDAFTVSDGGFGNVNNPEGATANKSDSSFKIRGFVTNNTLRNGFRRQHATDTVNIARVEVVRGPSAILYGVGNFGGVVNYLPKRPLERREESFTLGYGSDNWRRASLDVTGPLPFNLGYRLTAAYEDRDHFTELNKHDHWFISPVLEWKPFQRTTLTIDFEAGQANDRGIGFLSVRSPSLEGVNLFDTDQLETFGLLEFEGRNPRTFRWSGPDTYLRTDTWNFNIDLQQGFGEKVNFRIGYNKSDTRFEWRDVFGGILVNPENERALPNRATIRARQIIDGSATDVFVDVDNAVLLYNWNGRIEQIDWDQVRAEVNLRDRFFEPGTLFHSEHNLLLGASWERQKNARDHFGTADSPDNDNFMFANPTLPNYLRFDVQPDGSPSLPFRLVGFEANTSENEGLYAVYSGRFLNDRLFLIGGVRRDVTRSKDQFYQEVGGRSPQRFESEDSTVSKTTMQFGASYEVIRGINIFALQSEGVEPNFAGQRDGLGRAIESSVATSREVGVKFNFLDGRVAATLSAFRIEREGVPFSYWWAPAPARGVFNRNEDIIYRLDAVNLDRSPNNVYLQQAAAEWAAAKASGAVYQKPSADGRSTFTYINASTSEGAAYLDRVMAALNAEFALPFEQRTDLDPWAGFLYEGRDDPEVNNASQDLSSPGYFQSISDESKGWEAQIILSPTDQLQIVLNYSNVRRTVTNPGNFVQYPYEEDNWDRWAVWYWPNANWGLGGVPPEEAYPSDTPGLPNRDTSTWAGVGWGKGEGLDDTPKHVVSLWASYRFEVDFLQGFQVGLGGIWEAKREYASAFTSAGQKKRNETGQTIRAFTDPRLTVNTMIKYSWSVRERAEAYVQLNVDNALNDRSQYGLIYAPGRSWRFNLGVTF